MTTDGQPAVPWDAGRATVHDVLTGLAADRRPAYTTVMTVMSRLAEKRVLTREKVGRAYVYGPVNDQPEVAGSLLGALVDRLYAGSVAGAIEHLIEPDDDVDDAELEGALAHEMAHFRLRRPAYCSSELFRTLAVLNPLSVLLADYFQREEEKACDDIAVAAVVLRVADDVIWNIVPFLTVYLHVNTVLY